MTVSVVFSSVSWFEPGQEATGYVIQAWCPEPGDHHGWHYLINPKSNGFFTWDTAHDLCRKIALAGEIDPAKWSRDYPLSDFEAYERSTSKPSDQSD